MKKILTLIFLSVFCLNAINAEVTWEIEGNTLFVSGTGDMVNYTSDSAPWYSQRESINNVIIKKGVTSIGRYAFAGLYGLKSITIPNSVISIGECAFANCHELTSITIPNSVTSIDGLAFCYCTGLTSMKVESGNMYYDSRNNCNAIIRQKDNSLISGCKNTIIPNNVTSIGSSAFMDCFDLKNITIPNSVTSIGNTAFGNCSGLTSITIPNSVTSIGNYTFFDCI